jgi:hypothetical protein
MNLLVLYCTHVEIFYLTFFIYQIFVAVHLLFNGFFFSNSDEYTWHLIKKYFSSKRIMLQVFPGEIFLLPNQPRNHR